MRRCLQLARRGLGGTSPNPLVGCVIVQQDNIIAEGWHRVAGGPHAEVDAIAMLPGGRIPANAIVYVNLEPCAHYGKTPPCADLLIERGAKNVVIAMEDPFPEVLGKGIQKLRQTGIQVTCGILNEEARWLNRRFISRVERNRPWVILKWAETADGFMADPYSGRKQISGAAAQLILHKWRAEEGAFLIGKQTALNDNPQLTNRLYGQKQPVRIVVDPRLELPETLNLFKPDADTWILNQYESRQNAHLSYLAYGDTFFETLFHSLLQYGINSLVVEGGPDTLTRFLEAGNADEIRVIRSKKLVWETGIPAPKFRGKLREVVSLADDDVLIWTSCSGC